VKIIYLIEFKLTSGNIKTFRETLFGKINKRNKIVFYKFGILGEFKAKLEENKIYTEDDFTNINLINDYLTEKTIWKITKIKAELEIESVDFVVKKEIDKLRKKGYIIKKGRRFWVEKLAA